MVQHCCAPARSEMQMLLLQRLFATEDIQLDRCRREGNWDSDFAPRPMRSGMRRASWPRSSVVVHHPLRLLHGVVNWVQDASHHDGMPCVRQLLLVVSIAPLPPTLTFSNYYNWTWNSH